MRICLVYDCLFPYTVGGAERWYRELALRLRADGHDVTFLTMRQWPRDEQPDLPGVTVHAVAPRMRLYDGDGHRRILPPLVFGLGVLWHLLRHARRYDVVHTSSFPYFSLLAAALVRRLTGFRLVVDWVELWSQEYWREYLGPWRGRVGWWIQRRCVRVRQRAFCLARMTADRLRQEGIRGDVTVLRGLYAGALDGREPSPAQPFVVFAGRHIPEKRAPAAVAAIAAANRRIPGLRGVIFGDGPERGDVLRAIDTLDLGATVTAPGFVATDELEQTLRTALCLLHPSRREGYGLVVVECAAAGVPTVLVAGADNAATELVEDGVNGVIAAGDSADDLADAIVRVHAGGAALRESTAGWFARNARQLSLEASLDTVLASYVSAARRP
jgi:glycosyltransferase involved in cell wall biosynthesis